MTNPNRNLSQEILAGGAKALVLIFIFAGYFSALADIVSV